MLRELSVQNLAVIADVRVELESGFCAWTGETGAGKSLLLGALGLLLGERGSADLLRAGAEELRVTGRFELESEEVRREVERLLDTKLEEGEVILARRLGRGGRSHAYVNDQPVAVATLRALGGLLVDVHGQRESESLLQPAYQLQLLDAYGHLETPRQNYLALAESVRSLRKRFAGLAAERQQLTHAQSLQEFAAGGVGLLYDEEGSVVEQLGKLGREAQSWAALDPTLEEVVRRLEGLTSEVQDVAAALRKLGQHWEADPERLD